MGNTMRAILARRLKFTDELLANVRQRFEGSDEPLSAMAADLGCCKTTLRGIAKREGWVRYVPPPRELLPAAKLAARAEKLASSPLIPAHSPPRSQSGFALAKQGAGIQGGHDEGSKYSALGPRFRGDERILMRPPPRPSPFQGEGAERRVQGEVRKEGPVQGEVKKE